MSYYNNYRRNNWKSFEQRVREAEQAYARKVEAAKPKFEALTSNLDELIKFCNVTLLDDGRIRFGGIDAKETALWNLLKEWIPAHKREIVEHLGGVYVEPVAPKKDPVDEWIENYEPLKKYYEAETAWENYKYRERKAHEGEAGERNDYLFIKKPTIQEPGEMRVENHELSAVVNMSYRLREGDLEWRKIARAAFEKIAAETPILEAWEAYKQDAAPIRAAERAELERKMWID